MADQIVVHPDRLIPIKEIDAASAAVLTDAGLTAYHAVSHVRHRGHAATIAVVGVGGLGHLALQILRHLTTARLVAVDRRPAARQLALDSGAEVFCSPEDLPATLETLCSDGRVEAVVDFVGSAESIELASAHLLPDADLVIVGSAMGSLTVGKHLAHLPRGLHLHFPSWGSRAELAEVITLAEEGILRPHVSSIGLDEVVDGLARLKAGQVLGRLVAQPGGPSTETPGSTGSALVP